MIKNNAVILEQELLCGLIQDNGLVTKCDSIKANMFQVEEHRKIYQVILEMIKKNMSVDLINLLSYSDKKTKEMGGITYITEIASCSPTNANFETKVSLLLDEYKKRVVYKMVNKVQELNTIDEMTEFINKTLESVYKSDVVKDLDICNPYEEYLNNLYADDDKGFKTGLYKLDETIGNLQRGRLVTLFARSGIGKSTLAIQIALNLILQSYKVIYGSGEMSVIEVLNKMAASKLNIEYQKMNKKILTAQEKDRVTSFINNLMNKGFYITNETNINKVISEIKLYKLNNGLDILFIDYINKYISGMNGMSLTEKIGQVTSQLKDLALKEDICIVLLAQANRRADINESKNISEKITESDIQDSARIEQDSDQVISIYRNKKFDNKKLRDKLAEDGLVDYSSRNADKNPECVNLTILKNRHGEKNTLAFRWEGEYSRVSNFIR
ncbi:replicative DNA helicase [Eubacterium multiforme]|uniref:DNA 5'-3' helicase n=1 Tax=Eubacterium multiforme TaxID=83339 RepID=A0ABT9UUR8_9FIRM|nr:DnaB-like helicase C-terminal domain-containing protein [Eubacterium multiforme]MDQ0150062.1 replicative DNA helicase [Eubacterium multiforme]